MTIGQVPVQVMCNVVDGFRLHVEDVDGVGVPKMSMAISVKLGFPIHDLLKMLALWQERAVDEEGHTRRAKEAARKAGEVAAPLRNSPFYAKYKTGNSWEPISSPKVLLLDEVKLRAKTFAALPLPEHGRVTYAQFVAGRAHAADAAGTANAATSPAANPGSEATADSGQRPEGPPTPKAPPQGWTSPSWFAVVQQKASSAWESFSQP